MTVGSLVVAFLSLLGLGNVILVLVRWRLGGKSVSEVTVTSELTGTALKLVEGIEHQLDEARQELRVAKNETHQCQADLRQLTNRFDRLEHAAIREASWAERARDALLSQRWPDGLERTPPILTVIPTGELK